MTKNQATASATAQDFVPSVSEILSGVADKLKLTVDQVERALVEANIALKSPTTSDRRLQVLRIYAQGEKHSGEMFEFDQQLSPGVWAIVHPDNSAGKTSVLEFLVLPLRGASRDLPLDVLSWLRKLRMDVLVAGRPIRIELEFDLGNASCQILTADSADQLQASDSSALRIVAAASGADEVSRCIGAFFLESLRMEQTKVWQSTGGTDGEGAPQVHGWAAYFGACYLNPGGENLLLGDVSAVGLPARLLELFVDIPYSTALTQLSVATSREKKIIRQSQRRAEGDADARKSERDSWQSQLEQLIEQIAELRTHGAQELSALLGETDRTASELRKQRTALAEADQLLEATTSARIRAEQAHLDAQETWQAKQVLGRLNPVCCPRCEEPLSSHRGIEEREHANCAVCTRPLPEVDPETAEILLQALAADVEEARAAEGQARRLKAGTATGVDHALAVHNAASIAVDQALATSGTVKQLHDLELHKAGLEGRLAATGPSTSELSDSDSSQVISSVADAVRETVSSSASRLFPAMNTQIVELATRFGVKNLDSVRLNRAGQVNAQKAGVPTIFKKLSRGDRLRMRIATVIALLRTGADRGVTAHPGLLLIDSIAAEEVTKVPARTLIAELQAIAQEIPDLQIFFTTADPALVDNLLPDDRVITSDGEHLF
ncbi:hypothetical protein R3Q08_30860 [Rhodococcus erythropolis]|uniref:hypothetical protein n=1 Tax=Rhodococcus erythropolis TaxID=1833 RepID=UPI002949E196|nr:hypothetical protein [Rhodococcus erythropolis]MDV6212665.1 hypothetical protein [Rhodococcus erythropolis]